MIQQQICRAHGETIVHVGRKNDEMIGLCRNCVLTARPPLYFVEDVLKEIDTLKTQIITSLDKHLELNLQLLNHLEDDLKKFQNHQLALIDSVLFTISQQKLVMQKKSREMIGRTNNFFTFDQQKLIDHLEANKDSINFIDQKNEIKLTLEELSKYSFNKTCQTFYQIFPVFHQNGFLFENQNNHLINQLKCQIHQQDVIVVDLDEFYVQNRLCCATCISENPRRTYLIENTYNLWNEHQQQKINFSSQLQQTQSSFITTVSDEFLKKLEKIQSKISELQSKLDILNYKRKQLTQEYEQKQKLKKLNFCQYTDIQELIYIITSAQSNNQLIDKELLSFKQKVQELKQSNYTQFNQCCLAMKSIFNQLLQNEIPPIVSKPFEYEIQESYVINQYETCYALAINDNKDKLIISCGKIIKIFQLKRDSLQESQQLTGHAGKVLCLKFMHKKDNKFISAGDAEDKLIKIWGLDEKQLKWTLLFNLSGHEKGIFCLQINFKNDMIISGSGDKMIMIQKFMDKGWVNYQQLKVHKERINSLSLNKSETKLIACGNDKLISVSLYVKDSIWQVFQIIKVDVLGYRICFITNEMFTFEPTLSENLQIYEFNKVKNGFRNTRNVQVFRNLIQNDTCFFQQQYIESKQLLISKNGVSIDFIQRQQNGEFYNVQSIKLDDESIYGTTSEDGELLILWNKTLKQIQFRKYKDTQQMRISID